MPLIKTSLSVSWHFAPLNVKGQPCKQSKLTSWPLSKIDKQPVLEPVVLEESFQWCCYLIPAENKHWVGGGNDPAFSPVMVSPHQSSHRAVFFSIYSEKMKHWGLDSCHIPLHRKHADICTSMNNTGLLLQSMRHFWSTAHLNGFRCLFSHVSITCCWYCCH